ncbi:hypothetical protein [Flexivirga sp. B27]
MIEQDGTATALAVVDECVGQRVSAMRRVRYMYQGAVFSEHGILELSFGRRTSLWMDSGHDGEKLRVCRGRWIDPFAEPLSAENREFVRTSGKWTAFDIDAEDDLGQLIGRSLDRVEPMWMFMGKLVGVRLTFGPSTVVVLSEADELHVTWAC